MTLDIQKRFMDRMLKHKVSKILSRNKNAHTSSTTPGNMSVEEEVIFSEGLRPLPKMLYTGK